MRARADSSVFWPGITTSITKMRQHCKECDRMAPSQPSSPPYPPTQPQYPFQCICADYFHRNGHHYLVIVDRYSNWPIIERAENGAKGLTNRLRRPFSTFGIPDEISTDGGPEFTVSTTQKFLKDWSVHHRLSSVAFPHSNCQAEIGVKAMKRIIINNASPDGTLDTDSLQRTVLQYRNCPDANTGLSPHNVFLADTLCACKNVLRNRHMKVAQRWSEHTKRLPPLRVGSFVRIQNQTGPFPKKWDKTGVVTEVRLFDQYVVRVERLRKTNNSQPKVPPSVHTSESTTSTPHHPG